MGAAAAQDAAHTAQRSMRDVRSGAFRARREQRARKGWDMAIKTRFVGSTDSMRTDSYHTPSTQNNSTTNKFLGETARVRRDVRRAERFDENLTLGQRVKLRLAEPVDALL